MSITLYTGNLTQATHTNELHRTENIQLSVDYAQHGLGSASWGAECLEKDKTVSWNRLHLHGRFSEIREGIAGRAGRAIQKKVRKEGKRWEEEMKAKFGK